MMQPSPCLVITDTSGRRHVPIDKPLITLGRRSDSDAPVSGAGVSRHHAEIAVKDGTRLLRDCDSKSGTYVNGTRTPEHALVHGDQIRLGDSDETQIAFLVGDEDA